MKKNAFWLYILIVVICTGCGVEPREIEANEHTCSLENLKKIKDKNTQHELAGRCARLGAFKPSNPKAF